MRYVERNWKGEIVGLYANPQMDVDGSPRTEDSPLPDDHPEVAAYLQAHPAPDVPSSSMQDAQRLQRNMARVDKEHEELRSAVLIFNQRFNQLEIALSSLLYSILNIRDSRLAHAIYFSQAGFGARVELVQDCIEQIALEREPLRELAELWRGALRRKLDRTRDLRNQIAHGGPITLIVNDKHHVRYTSPAFDVKRVGRGLQNLQIPGLTKSDIDQKSSKVSWLRTAVDLFNRLIAEFHEGGPA